MTETAFLLVLPYGSDLDFIECPYDSSTGIIKYSSDKPFYLLGAIDFTNKQASSYLRISEEFFYNNSRMNSLIYSIGGGTVADTIAYFQSTGVGSYIQPGSYDILVS